MSDNENEIGKVGGWWAASTDADHEQISLYEVVSGRESLLDSITVTREDYPSLEDFKLEIKRQFGGGIYVAVVRGPSGTFGKRSQFAISGRPIREKAEEPAAAAAPQEGNLDKLAALMLQQQQASEQRLMAVLEKLADKPAAPQQDPLEMFDRVAGILQKTATPEQPKEKSLIDQAIERKFLQFMEEGMGAGGDDGSWAKDLIGAVMPAFIGGGALPAAAGDDSQGGGDAPPAADEQGRVMARLKALLLAMVQLAEFEVAHEKAVAGIAQKAGAHWPMLQGVIAREDAVELAAQLVPAVMNHREWFEGFRAVVIGGGKKETGNGTTDGGRGTRKKAGAGAVPRGAGKRGSRNAANAAIDG